MKDKNRLKRILSKYITDIVYFQEGHHRINARWVDARVISFKETDKEYLCGGYVIVGQDDDGSGEKWKEKDVIDCFKVDKKKLHNYEKQLVVRRLG